MHLLGVCSSNEALLSIASNIYISIATRMPCIAHYLIKSTWFHMFQSHLLQLSTTCWSHSKVYTPCISHHLDKWCTMTSSISHPFGCLWLSMYFWALVGLLDMLDTFCFHCHASFATWRCSIWNCALLRYSVFIATIHSTHNSTSKFNKTK